METAIKQCQNCKKEFQVEPEDFLFYEKIKVPPPTWCPECRMIRRFTWRNERTLYRRKCAATGKDIISMFDPRDPFVVYEHNYWWSDQWDQMASGKAYDFSKPFFEQFRELLESQPLINLANKNIINSEYCNHTKDAKNCYLVFGSHAIENVAYASGPVRCKDSYDLYLVLDVEKSYEITLSAGLYNVAFAYDSDNSFDSRFLRSCIDVNKSFGCVNRRSKTHGFFNETYAEEEYTERMKKIDLGSYRVCTAYQQKFEEFAVRYPRRFASLIKCIATTGDNVMNSKNCKLCFDVFENVEDSKFVMRALDLRDSYDGYALGAGSEFMYEVVDTGFNSSNNYFNVFTHTCRDAIYTYMCHNSSHLFGCVGLRNKQYCILNRQYTKEEYELLLPKVVSHMNEMPYLDRAGRIYRYGEFFPPEISPFFYNESIAQEYFPLTAVDAEARGYRWKAPDKKDYGITKMSEDLPDHIRDVPDNIMQEVIGCAHRGECLHQCTTAFKIIADELRFYREMNLPLPRLCPNCRHYQRLKQRNPLKLWHRKCTCGGSTSENGIYQNQAEHFHGSNHCPNEFETSYAPERPEVVYCEQCYQNEVM